MNKSKHPLIWFMLPAVLIAIYFVVFQPGRQETPATVAGENLIDSDPAPAGAIETEIPAASEPDQLASGTGNDQDEVEQDREFINYAFPLLSKWDLQEVKPLLAEETIAASSDEELAEVMSVLEERLGELKSFELPQPVTLEGAEPAQDENLDDDLQHYQFIAYYEAGQAEIDLVLSKRQNDNSLYSFNIHIPTEDPASSI